MSDAGSIDKVLRSVAPDRLVEAVDAHLRSAHGAKATTVWLADYRAAGLSPFGATLAEMSQPESQLAAATRAFASQAPATEAVNTDVAYRVHLPITAWGARVGVLSVAVDMVPAEHELQQLLDLAGSFACALQAVDRRTDRYHAARRQQRLTMAAEMQWDLLPARSYTGPAVQLAGQLEPAYAVCGDHFDWCVDGDWLTVNVLNGMGTGLEAAMLTTLAVNAMRNARRSGGDLADQATLAADAVYSQYGGTRHVSSLLIALNTADGRLRLVDAGSPRMFMVRGGQPRDVVLDPQLPLGMFSDTNYTEEMLSLQPGDRLFVVSDGVHNATRPNVPSYGERELMRAIRSTRLQPPAEAVSTVMRNLGEYQAGAELADDAVVVCLDWTPVAPLHRPPADPAPR